MTRRAGLWAARAIVVISIAYVATGATWFVLHFDVVRARGLEPSEPYLAILESLIVLLTPALVVMFAALQVDAPQEKKIWGLAAFGMTLLLAGVTGAVHFVQLTAMRRATDRTVIDVFAMYFRDTLSPVLAAELAAWDFFFGFALLFAAPMFDGDPLQAAIRRGFVLAGALCLIGTLGPATGNLHLQYPAIVGYAFVFPTVSALVVRYFNHRLDRQ